jgi:hypothetical protein
MNCPRVTGLMVVCLAIRTALSNAPSHSGMMGVG